jgi:hypothetical protein
MEEDLKSKLNEKTYSDLCCERYKDFHTQSQITTDVP